MILAKAPTTSDSNFLVSVGSFEVTVENTPTGEELEFTNWGCQCPLDIQTSPSIAHQNQGEFKVFDGTFQA